MLMNWNSSACRRLVLAVAMALLGVVPAHAQHANHGPRRAASSECTEAVLKCASKVTPSIGPDGRIWIVFAAGGQILVSQSADDGRTFAPPTAVYSGPGELDWGPDARPKIAIAPNGSVHVAFALFKDKHFNGQVLHARSDDGGRTFTKPEPITDVQESQRFEAIGFDPEGRLFAAWLDKRNRVPARQRGERYMGAALAYAWVGGDARFGAAVLAQDNTCECCRVGLTFAGAGRPVVLFRNIFEGGVRDHAVMAFDGPDKPGPVRRVSIDAWKTDACPHHGPALSLGGDGALHVVWFTSGAARKGLFYARSSDRGVTFTEPRPIGDAARAPSRPSVLAQGARVVLVWKEFDGKTATLVAQTSVDGGVNWSEPRQVAATDANSDSPLLIARHDQALVSWMTEADGYRLIVVEPRP